MSFYLVSMRPMPSTEAIELQANFALIDWAGIPTSQLERVCIETRRQHTRDVITHGDVWCMWVKIRPNPEYSQNSRHVPDHLQIENDGESE